MLLFLQHTINHELSKTISTKEIWVIFNPNLPSQHATNTKKKNLPATILPKIEKNTRAITTKPILIPQKENKDPRRNLSASRGSTLNEKSNSDNRKKERENSKTEIQLLQSMTILILIWEERIFKCRGF